MSRLDAHGGWPAIIGALLERRNLDAAVAADVMATILAGDATEAQIAGFVVALRAKGEVGDELAGMLDAAMAEAAVVPLADEERAAAIDVVGTGGDGSHSINVSTMAALVVAGAGVPVCKHGNRSASSKCGTADVLELLGVAIELEPAGVARCVRDVGIGFCFAPRFHPAFRFAGPPRREMGVPTVFNLLGPMANPGQIQQQLIGVADRAFAPTMVEALDRRGLRSAWVVHGGGLDELTTTGVSHVVRLLDGEVDEFTVDPVELGLARASVDDLRGGSPDENAEAVRRVLGGEPGPHRDIVVLNAAAALVVARRAASLGAGVELAATSIDSGAAQTALASLVSVSQEHAAS